MTQTITSANLLIDLLSYNCYAYNRDLGMTHEKLIFCGLGNDGMRIKYDQEQSDAQA